MLIAGGAKVKDRFELVFVVVHVTHFLPSHEAAIEEVLCLIRLLAMWQYTFRVMTYK